VAARLSFLSGAFSGAGAVVGFALPVRDISHIKFWTRQVF